ncbi:MAG: hypothetical protein Q7R90_03285 [bacterium]|nr:hypothetical protein [bacterium]
MKSKVNTYLAMLLITVAGAVAVLMIIRIAEANNFDPPTGDNAASYDDLKQLILEAPIDGYSGSTE